MKYAIQAKPYKLAQFAVNVFDVHSALGSDTEIALEGVKRTGKRCTTPSACRQACAKRASSTPIWKCSLQKALPDESSAIGAYIPIRRQDALEIFKLAE